MPTLFDISWTMLTFLKLSDLPLTGPAQIHIRPEEQEQR